MKREREELEVSLIAKKTKLFVPPINGVPFGVWSIILSFCLDFSWNNVALIPLICKTFLLYYQTTDYTRFLLYMQRGGNPVKTRTPCLTPGYCNAFGHLLVHYVDIGTITAIKGQHFHLSKDGDNFLLYCKVPVKEVHFNTYGDMEPVCVRDRFGPEFRYQRVTKQQLVGHLPIIMNGDDVFVWRLRLKVPQQARFTPHSMVFSNDIFEDRKPDTFPWWSCFSSEELKEGGKRVSFCPEEMVAILQRPRDFTEFAYSKRVESIASKSENVDLLIYSVMTNLLDGCKRLW